jgi:DsbC/DsbD-like thiol-disulfide interchange protein
MKKIILGVLLLLSGISGKAQIVTPVKWAYAAKKINNREAIVYLKATIDKGWHIYSQNVGEGGPVKTSFAFAKSDDYQLVDKTAEPAPKTKFEKAFDMKVTYFENAVIFQQKVKLVKPKTTLKGTLTYMVCSNKECLPPEDVEFSVAL